jgi:6-phospho-beta-glucosidase
MAREGSRGRLLAKQQRAFYEGSFESDAEALDAWRRVKDLRHGTYMAEAWSTTAGHDEGEFVLGEGPGEAGYGAIAAGFLRAVTAGEPASLILDSANRGRLPFLPDDAVIEAPWQVADTVEPLPVGDLPSEQRSLIARVKEVERTTIRAARTGSAALALDAIAAHPVVPSRDVAERILSGYLERQPGLREQLR